MPISEKDEAFMKKVSAYYRNTKTEQEPYGSIRDTALHFGINRNKVRKILVTTGDLEMPLTDEVVRLRLLGKSIKEIADELDVSVATVSTALPYETKIDNSFDPSQHAAAVRSYREYERKRARNQAPMKKESEKPNITGGVAQVEEKEWQKEIKMSYRETYHRPHRMSWADMEELRKDYEAGMEDDDLELMKQLMGGLEEIRAREAKESEELDKLEAKSTLTLDEQNRMSELRRRLGRFPGALNDREKKVLERIAGNRLPPEPMGVMRLHMELYSEFESEKVTDVLHRYGEVKYGNRISRDVVIPNDLPLYALHYVIQRAFGWENSHLHQFTLPRERIVAMTSDNLSHWSVMVGILFRSPLMDENDPFWADDYNGGSFKNWLRKKYTGPYLSQCQGEGLLSCQEDMMRLDMNEEYYLLFERQYNHTSGQYDGKEYLSEVWPVLDHNGKKQPKPKPYKEEIPYRVETVRMLDIPMDGIQRIFEQDPFSLVERLPLFSVLASGKDKLPEQCNEEERTALEADICHSVPEMYQALERYIHNVIDAQIDSPERQVTPLPCTDTLLYEYDFGDSWRIKITASDNCPDLVESGRITQAEMDRANVKCRETYRPVMLARDGAMLMDDVGGLHGYADFLCTINPDLDSILDPDEKAKAKQEKKESLIWAKSMGWKKDNATNFNLL